MLVEAEEALTTLYGHFLRTAGFAVLSVRTPADAVQHVRTHGKPDLVFADVSNSIEPDVDLQQLRGAVGNVPIVAIGDTYRPDSKTADWTVPNSFAVSEAGTLLRDIWMRIQEKHARSQKGTKKRSPSRAR